MSIDLTPLLCDKRAFGGILPLIAFWFGTRLFRLQNCPAAYLECVREAQDWQEGGR